jgi:uncharacterized protein YjbI with pentapeptide repeats
VLKRAFSKARSTRPKRESPHSLLVVLFSEADFQIADFQIADFQIADFQIADFQIADFQIAI